MPMLNSLSRRQLLELGASAATASVLPLSANADVTSSSLTDHQHTTESSSVPLAWSMILPGVWKLRIGRPDRITPVSARFFAPADEALKRITAHAGAPINATSAEVDGNGITIKLPLSAGENLYGFGLQMYSFNQRGTTKTLRVNANPPSDTGDSHAPVPMYVSSKGYAVFVDTARNSTFCCGTARTIEEPTEEQSSGYAANAVKLQEGESAYVTVRVDGVTGIDIYLFGGPSMLDAIRRYNLFAGGGANPPEWGLGVWYRPYINSDDKDVLRLATEFRQRDIPCDVIGLEPGWMTHAYSCTFEWSDRFPDPAEFVRQLGEIHYKVNLWEHAFVHPTASFYAALKPYSGDYLVWQGLTPDFCTVEARRIFGDHHRRKFVDIGISGFKLDECDNSDYTAGWSFPEFSRFPSGQNGEQMHSMFGLVYQRVMLEQFNAANVRTYGLVRSSGALATPYPFVLYSDLYDHRVFVRALVNSGFTGLLWSPEVRYARSKDDLIRRLQTVVFSPMALLNCNEGKNPPWKQPNVSLNNANEFDAHWEALETRCREILQWRMMLLPYLRGTFARYAADGTPPFRALVLEDPDDSALSAIDDQFMVGDRLMVAPMFDGDDGRKVILPRGTWHDFWTGALVEGDRPINVPCTYDRVPVYVKTNVVMPIGGHSESTADTAARGLTVRIFGDGSTRFEIAGQDEPVLHLSWANGRGTLRQKQSASPYSVERWIKSTDAWI